MKLGILYRKEEQEVTMAICIICNYDGANYVFDTVKSISHLRSLQGRGQESSSPSLRKL